MIRKFQTLGLALVAVLAMGAVVASVAQARRGMLITDPPLTAIITTSEQTAGHKISLTDHLINGVPASTECTIAKFDGIASSPSEEGDTSVTVQPVYEGCKAFGLNATIATTGCDYLLHTGAPVTGGWHVTTDVVCAGSSLIKIVTATCEVTIGSQSGLATSSTTNSGGIGTAMDMILHTEITGLTYTVTKDGIGCPLSGTGSFSKGDYTGATTVKAHSVLNGSAVGITSITSG